MDSLLLCGLALQTIHHFHGAVSLAPVDAVLHRAGASAMGHQQGREADVGPHHAVVRGQTGSDAFHALADGHLHATDISAAGVTWGTKTIKITNITALIHWNIGGRGWRVGEEEEEDITTLRGGKK